MPRDDFKQSVIDTLARRASYLCCNPECRDRFTSLPHSATHRAVNLGVAAHICAAAPGGPRYDPEQSPAERSSIENAIWLCQRCAAEIDRDVPRYDVKQLQAWKQQHEAILASAPMRTAVFSIGFRNRQPADAAIATEFTADSKASSSTPHSQRVLDASLDDILTELPHVTNETHK